MNAFQPGDKVLVEAELVIAAGDWAVVRFDRSPMNADVPLDALHPAPKPLYVDPELVPGMVVAPLDAADDREWWVTRDDTSAHYGDRPFTFFTPDGIALERGDLPRFRVVFDPREASS
jgi:hypothetical protein